MFSISRYFRLIQHPILKSGRCNCSGKTGSNYVQKLEENKEVTAKEKYDPKKVEKGDMRWRTPWHKKDGEYFNLMRVIHSEKNKTSLLKTLHAPIDLSPSSIKKWWSKQVENYEIGHQCYLPQRNQALGDELAAAHFIVSRGGAVKFFDENVWIKANEDNEYDLPRFYEEDKILQAIDCTDMTLYYEGLMNMADLQNVEWLSLNGCEKMDDWCLDKVTNIFSHSLIYLDIRNCPNITYKSIGAIYKLQNLKILYLDDFLRSTTYEYTCLLLEDIMPNLQIKSDPVTFEV